MEKQIGEIRSNRGDVLLKMFDVTTSFHTRPVSKHRHTQFEIAYVLSGTGTYCVGSETYPIAEGDVFVFSSNEFHYITEVTSAPINLLTLQFEPCYLFGSSFDSLSSRCINLCFTHSECFRNRIPAAEAGFLQSTLLQIKEELRTQAQESALLVKSYLNIFLVSLIRNHNFVGQSRSFKRKNVHAIRNAVDFINLHLAEPISLSDVAAAVHVSPSHLSSLFKNFFQVSLWSYIITKRIERAILLLMDKDNQYTILEIALQCGFNNTTNFNRAFRKHTGLTPSEYRNSPPQ
jgi:AraC-like DNA-binding protein